MPHWTAFAGVTGVVLLLILVLSHLTQTAFTSSDTASGSSSAERSPALKPDDDVVESDDTRSELESSDPRFEAESDVSQLEADAQIESHGPVAATDEHPPFEHGSFEAARTSSGTSDFDGERIDPRGLSTGALLANVAFSQGLFAVILIGMAVVTGIPADALGIEFSQAYLVTGLVLGTVVGLVFYVLNELGAASARRYGLDFDEELRELLAPETIGGWLVLLLVVLPIIAVFEEFLFRAAMIGALSAGFGVSPWLLAVVSSVAFALGHGMQGRVGVIVTGTLGFALAAVFIVTGSLLVVIVAHYLINALEFVVHEGIGFEWSEPIGG